MKLFSKVLAPFSKDEIDNWDLKQFQALTGSLTHKLLLLQVPGKEVENPGQSPDTLQQIEKLLKKSGIEVQVKVQHKDLAEAVPRIARDENADLLMRTDFVGEGISKKENETWYNLIRESLTSVWIARQGKKQPPKKIICPVDFSNSSMQALTDAIRLCKAFDAELTVLTTFEPMVVSFPTRLNIDYESENQAIEDDSRRGLNAFLKDVDLESVRHQSKVVEGKPALVIVEEIKKQQADLVVMGATGKSILQRFFLGSVTESVMQQLPCSMLIVKRDGL